MTLQEVAEDLARSMDAEVQPGDNESEITVKGKGYHFVVASFFGGWQATLYIPDQKPITFFGEASEMLALRMKAKLTGRDHNF